MEDFVDIIFYLWCRKNFVVKTRVLKKEKVNRSLFQWFSVVMQRWVVDSTLLHKMIVDCFCKFIPHNVNVTTHNNKKAKTRRGKKRRASDAAHNIMMWWWSDVGVEQKANIIRSCATKSRNKRNIVRNGKQNSILAHLVLRIIPSCKNISRLPSS